MPWFKEVQTASRIRKPPLHTLAQNSPAPTSSSASSKCRGGCWGCNHGFCINCASLHKQLHFIQQSAECGLCYEIKADFLKVGNCGHKCCVECCRQLFLIDANHPACQDGCCSGEDGMRSCTPQCMAAYSAWESELEDRREMLSKCPFCRAPIKLQ